ncbi:MULTISPECIES: carbamoyltransferase family protein [Pseudofrankia]|uniref:carbamoyltransferase family protein n=1 Tax=Pseudofrankia TaxID=2994363 RepID=UPI0002F6A710|nr:MULTISPECIES: carbamoyltransferase C-terminal domain-containing protein [Pseudofrankia]
MFGHDAAACLLRDGRLIAMMEEERGVRTPHAPGTLPLLSTMFCLAEAGVRLGDLDHVAASWDPARDPSARYLKHFVDRYLGHEMWRGEPRPPVEYVDHHLAHAASTYYGSGLPEAAVVVVDGNGEDVSTSIGYGHGGSLRLDQRFGIGHSLGQFYTCVTSYLGLGGHAEGKTMGLAAYGRANDPVEPIQVEPDGYRVDLPNVDGLDAGERFSTLTSHWFRWLEDRFGPPRPPRHFWDVGAGLPRRQPAFSPHQADIAASAQTRLTFVMLHLARVATTRYDTRRLVIAGGVGLNCSANGAIALSGLVDDLYVVPAAHDGGGALGAAMWLTAAAGTDVEPLEHPYHGPAVDQTLVADRLRELRLPFTEPPDPFAYTADLLAQGQVIGWMQGRGEIGPRALGNRSILALPASIGMRDRVNALKGRESWRPLAPAILDRGAPELIGRTNSPYMLLALPTTDVAREAIPAAVHVDGTTRAQVVSHRMNPRFHHLLEAVEERTGRGALLNTSFNLSGESIVNNVGDAIRSFASSALDALVVEGLVIQKRSALTGRT